MEHTKAALRRRLRAALRGLGEGARREAEARAIERLHGLITELGAPPATVGLYAAVGLELDLAPLARALAGRGHRVAWPRVVGPGVMEFARADPDHLTPGFRQIPEPPPAAPPLELAALDLIAVPGIGFDADGRRLGQGGGYYDRLLADPRRRAVAVGVGFGCQIVARVPVAAHDVTLDAVVTERGVARRGRWLTA